ncbi:hypothetical protein ABT187_40840 [Streptomyces sp. NPDC001817]|uniref:hypothetical protein n=1 Tax=Streptomyces sp. NPDC001817 TaxID=3154398 RepID=UPI003325C805
MTAVSRPWASEADLAVDSGQALLDLGDTARAHNLITEGERLLPSARDKTRSVFLTHRAALDDRTRQHWLALPTRLPRGRPTLISQARSHHRDAVWDVLDAVLDRLDTTEHVAAIARACLPPSN